MVGSSGRGGGRGRGKGGRRGTIDDLPRDVRISKALTQILRHRAVDLGLTIRPDGYVRIQELLECKTMGKLGATVEDVEQITLNSDKRRFEIMSDQSATFIRAVQGHSIKIVQDEELMRQLSADDPDLPTECVHGTYKRHVQAILGKGLIAGGKLGNTFRNHVHFAPYAPGDGRVISGMRLGSDVVIWVNLREALRGGVPFFRAKNEVILSPGIDGVVPPEFIEKICNIKTGEVLSSSAATSSSVASASAEAEAMPAGAAASPASAAAAQAGCATADNEPAAEAPAGEQEEEVCTDDFASSSPTGNSPASAPSAPSSPDAPRDAATQEEAAATEPEAEESTIAQYWSSALERVQTWFSERPDSPALL